MTAHATNSPIVNHRRKLRHWCRVCARACARGHVVAATARNERRLGLADSVSNIHAFAGDITDRAGMAALVEAIERDLGPIDLAV